MISRLFLTIEPSQVAKVFIDGQAGTTGLEISARLRARDDIELLEIDPASRKDNSARERLMAAADVVILCLPDDAAGEAVTLAGDQCRILDASTAHRIAPGWIYGLPEMQPGQREAIAEARLVANPGCYPQGFILLIRPLIDEGLLSPEIPLSLFGISGYSGGGKALIEKYDAFDTAQAQLWNTRPYALQLQHKHVPEMHHYSQTAVHPLFSPVVGNYYRGMLLEIPLFISQLRKGSNLEALHELFSDRYADEPFVDILPLNSACMLDDGFLSPTHCNNTNQLQLMLFGHEHHVLLMARYDNLGKGAAGAAIQNLNLMTGSDERTGLQS